MGKNKSALLKSVKTTFENKKMDILHLAFEYHKSDQYSFNKWFSDILQHFKIDINPDNKTSKEARFLLGSLVNENNVENFIHFIHYLMWCIGKKAYKKKRLKNTINQDHGKNRQLTFWKMYFIENNKISNYWYFGMFVSWGDEYKKI